MTHAKHFDRECSSLQDLYDFNGNSFLCAMLTSTAAALATASSTKYLGKHIDESAAAVQRLGNTELKINLSIAELMRVIHIKPRG